MTERPQNVLIVDGYATGTQYAARIRARGMKPYHITSGWEKLSSFSPDFMNKYIKSQVGGLYEACWRMPDDLEQAVQKLKPYRFAAVIPGTETGVIAAETLALRLGLPVNKPELLWARRDKFLMQKALAAAGLNHIDSFLTGSLDQALAWFKQKNYPRIIIKPARSAGTDGVASCQNEDEIARYFHKYLHQTDAAGNLNDQLLLQEYVEGDEMVVNCVSCQGRHILTDVLLYNKVLTRSGVPVYEASKLVHDLSGRYKQAAEYTFKVLDALGITRSSSHSEIKLTDRGPVLVETGARIMGSTPPQYYDALGYNLIDWSLDAYLDPAAHQKNARRPYAPKKHFMAKFFISEKDAPIEEVTAEKTLPLLASFVTSNFNTLKITKHLHKTVDMPSKPGDCLLMADSELQLLRDYNLCRFMEKCRSGLLWREAGQTLTDGEKLLLSQLKAKEYPQADIDRALNGYRMGYMNYKNTQLYVLNGDLLPCQAGEKGEIYVTGAYLAKRPYDLPCVKKENFLPNPFYSAVTRQYTPMYPFLYKTGDYALANADGSLWFIDKKTNKLTHSFGKHEPRPFWPLTYTERQMAAEQRLSPSSNAYNAKFAFKIAGQLDLRRFKEALKIWVGRYRIFSSYYPTENGRIVHKLAKDLPVALTVFSCPFGQAMKKIEELNAPYDIAVPPLYRFYLFKTGAKEYVFHMNAHHIIADGVSVISIIEELWKLYKNRRAKKFRLEEEDFLDYALWQEQNPDYKDKAQFFLDMFKDGVPENEMPLRGLRPEILPHAAQVSAEYLFPTARVDAAAKTLGVSPSLLLTALSAAALAKYAASEDFVLGVIMNGRSHPQSKNIFGMFVNAVPVRFKPQGALTLQEYLQRSNGVFRGVIANQTCPLEYLVPVLAPRRDLSRKPLFDVIVNYRPEIRPFSTPEINVTFLQMRQATQTDMQLEILRGAKDINVSVSYSRQLYQDEVITGILDLFKNMLDQILQGGGAHVKLSDLTALPAAQRKQILSDFAGTRTAPAQETVVDAFRRMARANAARPAAACEGRVLTYKQLDEDSDRLAVLLAQKGLKRGDKAGILVARSENLLVYALGILKAGAAYVPLDSSHPRERIQFMLKDAAVKLVIADEEFLPLAKGAAALTPKQLAKFAPPAKTAVPPAPAMTDDFVILYTSGTTGRPKGVALTHQNLAVFCQGHRKRFRLGPQDRVASSAGLGFDACLMDFYPTLTCGGCVHIIAQDIRFDIEALNEYYLKNQITGTLLTTQLGYQFVKNIKKTSLRYLIVGGETLTPVQPPKTYKLVNAYGPTECTVYASCFTVDKFYDRVPIGHPADNCSVYIVDKAGRLAPVGTFGELCIAGPNVARGYLNHPKLTAEKFVPNPFSTEKGFERMYRTGDFARFNPQGILEFLGRKDGQVKIRGFRIELNEIELQLRKFKTVLDATVIAREDKSGNKYVAAYFVSDKKTDAAALKRFLEDSLPPYMIPAFFVQVDHIPLNPNGKVDRRALPEPDLSARSTAKYAAPQGRIEKELMYIWAQLLNMDPAHIGRDDNFFDLGGTSLRSTELSLRIRDVFREHISPALIFKYPTLREQAEYLDSHNSFPMVHAFNTQGDKTPLIFIHTANAGSEAYVPLAAKLPPDQPFYAVEPHNIFSGESVIRGIPQLAKRYIKYIRRVQPKGPYSLGGWSFGAAVAYEIAVQLEKAGEQVEWLFLLDPLIEHSPEEQELTKKLIGTSFFHGYLNNDPLFARFKKLGLVDKLLSNSKAVFEDMFAFKPRPYGGNVILFKATRPDPPAKDIDPAMARALLSFQRAHIAQKDNGFKKYVRRLQVIPIFSRHDFLMRGNALEIIARVIAQKGKRRAR